LYYLAGRGLRRCVYRMIPMLVVAGEGGARNGDKGYHVEDAEECMECVNLGWGCGFGVMQKVAHWV